jgi:drug/metabolite transporter (DMT)-like permease
MDPLVFVAVLAAAALHAGWNALLKSGGDRMSAMTLMSLGHWLPAAAMLPFVGWIEPAAWPYLIVSTLLHAGYRIFPVLAQEAGDMSQVYPLARGSAPLLTLAVAVAFTGEILRWPITAGIALMSLRGGADLSRIGGKAFVLALLTSVFICGYTLADGLGARVGGNALAYAALLFLLDTPLTFALALAIRGRALLAGLRGALTPGPAGGAISLVAYAAVIWVMTVAPIPAVAAVRETSVLFGLAIAVIFLGERFTGPRLAASALIVAGAVCMRIES